MAGKTRSLTFRLQQRTGRAFVTDAPAGFAAWLVGRGLAATEVRPDEHEFGRFVRNQGLVIVYEDGTVVVGGSAAPIVATWLAAICEPAPSEVCLFDGLETTGRN
jgi:hypothetical protein